MSRRIILLALLFWTGVALMYGWAVISHKRPERSPTPRLLSRPFAVSPEDFKP